jgi:hypothetical protein
LPKSPKIAKKSEPQTFEVKKNRGSGGWSRVRIGFPITRDHGDGGDHGDLLS